MECKQKKWVGSKMVLAFSNFSILAKFKNNIKINLKSSFHLSLFSYTIGKNITQYRFFEPTNFTSRTNIKNTFNSISIMLLNKTNVKIVQLGHDFQQWYLRTKLFSGKNFLEASLHMIEKVVWMVTIPL